MKGALMPMILLLATPTFVTTIPLDVVTVIGGSLNGAAVASKLLLVTLALSNGVVEALLTS
jgi:hypothetical protein